MPYGSSLLLREVQDRAHAVLDVAAVTAFISPVGPPLALAIGWRTQARAEREFPRQVVALYAPLRAALDAPTQPLGSRRLQALRPPHGDRRAPMGRASADRGPPQPGRGSCAPR